VGRRQQEIEERDRRWQQTGKKVQIYLEQALKTQWGIDIQLYSSFNFGHRWGSMVNATLRPLYPRERGWVFPKIGVDVCGKSRPTGIRFPDRPARNKALC
jgi:hypothetical protein